MKLIRMTLENAAIFAVLAQNYEAEFSSITHKEPNAEGRFAIEVEWHAPNQGFYLFHDGKPSGFAIIQQTEEEVFDIAEFYILPCYRKKGYGKWLAFALFDLFHGAWQSRQIITAQNAIQFWQKVIQEYTNGHYAEDIVEDAHWGKVLRQSFHSRAYL